MFTPASGTVQFTVAERAELAGDDEPLGWGNQLIALGLLPISDPDRCNGRPLAYRGPVVAAVSPNTFSTGDIFAAGLADHDIATIVSIGEATGAGGANVWTKDDIEYAYHTAGLTLPTCPAGISYSISMRRIVRASTSAGIAIEDIGILGKEQYTMTQNDILNSNHDLLEFCGQILAESR